MKPSTYKKIQAYLATIKTYTRLVEEELLKASDGRVGAATPRQIKREELRARAKSLFKQPK